MIMEMTGYPIANASLLDEGTAAAEAMFLCYQAKNKDSAKAFFVAQDCFQQTIEVVKTRAGALGIEVVVGDPPTFDFKKPIFGALLQYPTVDGAVVDYRQFIHKAHGADALVVMAADLLALAVLTPPGELGADVAVGSTQRFGIPMGFGGPSASQSRANSPRFKLT